MKFKLLTITSAIACAVLFSLVAWKDWLRAIFHCEGFGCIGLGILYLALAALIVGVFAVAGALFGPRPRGASALFAGGAALVAMMLAFGFIDWASKARDAEGFAEYQRACDRYPKLCPGLPEPLRSRQPPQ